MMYAMMVVIMDDYNHYDVLMAICKSEGAVLQNHDMTTLMVSKSDLDASQRNDFDAS